MYVFAREHLTNEYFELFPEVQLVMRESTYSPPSNTDVRKAQNFQSSHPYSFKCPYHGSRLFAGLSERRLACDPRPVRVVFVRAMGVAVGFLGRKILSTPSFGGEVKPSVPCRSFTACKRSLNITWNSAFTQNYRTFLAHSSTFRRWVLSRGDTHGDAWWRKLERLTKIAQ